MYPGFSKMRPTLFSIALISVVSFDVILGKECNLEYRLEVLERQGVKLELVWIKGLAECLDGVRCTLEEDCSPVMTTPENENATESDGHPDCLIRSCTFNSSRESSTPLELPRRIFFPLESVHDQFHSEGNVPENQGVPPDPSSLDRFTTQSSESIALMHAFIASKGYRETENGEVWTEKIPQKSEAGIMVPFWAFIIMCVLTAILAFSSLVLFNMYWALRRKDSFSLMDRRDSGKDPARTLSYAGVSANNPNYGNA